jgi:SAM-dependent methyltransferase
MNDTLHATRQYWDGFAATDPLWAVLSFPDKSDGRWTISEFMKTGEREIALLFHRFSELQVPIPTGNGLDFGCGVGRLTQALARRMTHVVGADLSPVMIELAQRLNHYPDRAQYLCTADRGLATLPSRSFQCIYSNIVLQHVAPDISVRYLDDFFRLLEPRGLLVFQLPSHRQSPADAEIKAMPDGAYSASIEFDGPPPSAIPAGEPFSVRLRVRNASPCEWSQPLAGPLAVGNHWLDERGELMLAQDDGRSPLLQVVPPDLEWPVLLTMRAPAEPGRYVCEIDLVHEGISWFGHKGSPTMRVAIDVAAGAHNISAAPAVIVEYPIPDYAESAVPRPVAPSSATPAKGDFPMHGVPRDEVMRIIRRHGARLVYLEEDRRAGPEWVSYRYFVVGAS